MTVATPTNWPDAPRFLKEWFRQRNRLAKQPRQASKKSKLLVFPSDPDTLVGSKGDEAMLLGYLGKIAAPNSDFEVIALCRSQKAHEEARRLGLQSRSTWDSGWAIRNFAKTLNDVRPDYVAIMGADIMDGYYNPCVSAERYAFADLSSRANIPTTILGFSFSSHPVTELQPIIQNVNQSVKFPLRDPVSLDRWQAFSGRPGELVADVAFLLKQEDSIPGTTELDGWVSSQRNARRTVLGFNVHQLLFQNNFHDSIFTQLAQSLDKGIDRGISWLLLPHDVRTKHSDLECLRKLQQQLAPSGCHFLLERELGAAQIKSVAGKLDGLISGRMHLAIAALGMATPIAAFGYLGKFEGLFQHFAIDPRHLGNLTQLLDQRALTPFLLEFSDNLSANRDCVRTRLPTITNLASKNLDLQCTPFRETLREKVFRRFWA